jgi:hypothetical protein
LGWNLAIWRSDLHHNRQLAGSLDRWMDCHRCFAGEYPSAAFSHRTSGSIAL